jgi:hypothetical protein
MTDLVKPGQHPDADQLNAFVENALPIHERQQTLAHLSTCADCRGIVYLSQQSDLGVFPASPSIPARKPWFSSWKLAWPMAAALACVVVFTVHLRETRINDNKTVITTTATIQKMPSTLPAPTKPSAPLLPLSDQPKPVPPRASRNTTVNASATAPGAVTEANTPSLDGTLRSQSVTALSLQGRNTTFLPPAGPLSTSGSIHGTAFSPAYASGGPVTKVIAGPIGGAAVQASPANTDAVDRPLQKAASVEAPQGNQIDFSAKRALSQKHQPAASPLSATSPVAVVGSSQIFSAIGAMTAIDATTSDQSPIEKRLLALPSHLPVLSIVSNARETIAIDISGTLFLSKDRGVSWQVVPAQWIGRGLKLRLAPSSSQTVAKDTEGSPAPPGAMINGGPMTQTHPSTFELTIDTGAIWTSIDGQTWKQK